MTADRQNTPQDAPHARLSDFQAPQAPGDGATAYDAAERAQRYADALALDLDGEHAFCASHSATGSAWSCACGEVFTDRHGHAAHLSAVRTEAVMAVADQETAELRAEVERLRAEVIRVNDRFAKARQANTELRAEVERLRRGGAELGRILDRTLNDALDASGRYDVIQEDGDGDWAVVWETLAELRPRAEAAEADAALLRSENVDAHAALDRAEAESARLASVVAKVEALIPTREQIDQHRRLPWIDHNDLRAVLASVAPDTATPGEATR